MKELDWPAPSPDLNPIQLLWDQLERDHSALVSVANLTHTLVADWERHLAEPPKVPFQRSSGSIRPIHDVH